MSIKSWDTEVIEVVQKFMAEQVPFNRYLGMEVKELQEGFARMEIPFRPELIGDPFQPALHGGVISALIDACGGAAALTTLDANNMLSTLDLRIDYLRPGEEKRLICESTVTRRGNHVVSVDMKTFHQENPTRLLATGKGVYSIFRSR